MSDDEIRFSATDHDQPVSDGNLIEALQAGQVNNRLRQKDEVLAFCSCRPSDGGTGAVYVLLRRTTK